MSTELQAGTKRSERRLVLAIFLATFSAFLLTSGRERPWGDGNVQYMVTESLVEHHSLDIPRPWPDDLPPGRNGKFYSTYPILTSVVQIPGKLLLEGISHAAPKARRFALPLTSHLACSFFGALCCLLFYGLCRQRRLSIAAASIGTAVLAFATTIWVYAHYSYSEIAQAAFVTGFILELLRTAEAPTPRRARWLGLWAGLLFSVKYIYAASLIGGGIWLALRLRGQWRLLGRLTAWAAVTAVPFLIVALIYNWLCWGSPFVTGYTPYFHVYWGENILFGLWGMFLSPGKSVFLYSPPLILGLLALPLLWREHRDYLAAVGLVAGLVLLVYARYKLNGDYAWGPRFVVFAVPLFGFSFAALFDRWRRRLSRPTRAVVAGFVLLGVGVNVLGNALYWDHYIRISMDARDAWLGAPNRRGAIIPVRADGHCDSCFEDVRQLEWLPPFQPILGHLWLLESLARGDNWKRAEAHAPWHRYTKLQLNISRSYPRARLDWWGMLWIKDFPAYQFPGILLLLLFVAGTGLGAAGWIRAHRALVRGAHEDDPDDAPANA